MNFQIKRLLSQITIFFSVNLGAVGLKTGFCYPFFYCHACPASTSACPLRAIEQSVYKGSFQWRFLFYPIMILGFLGVLSGRAVCGWACPIGLLQRITGKAARKLKKHSIIQKIGQRHPFHVINDVAFPSRGIKRLVGVLCLQSMRFIPDLKVWVFSLGFHKKVDRYLRYTKYVVLIGLVFVTSTLIGFMFTDICPIGFLTGTIPILILNPGKFVPSPFFWTASVVFILFLVLIFTIERGWCRYFCPIGALLAPFNKISFLHVSLPAEAVFEKECLHCDACSKACPMGIDVPNMNRDPECILCGKCINACPKNLIKFERGN